MPIPVNRSNPTKLKGGENESAFTRESCARRMTVTFLPIRKAVLLPHAADIYIIIS